MPFRQCPPCRAAALCFWIKYIKPPLHILRFLRGKKLTSSNTHATKLSISPSMDAEPTLWIEFANPIKAEIRFYSLRNVRISWISPKTVVFLCLARVLSPATVNPKPYTSLEAIRSTKKHIDLVKPLPHNPSTICPTLSGIQASFPNPRTHKP